MNEVLLKVKDLRKYFSIKKGLFSKTVDHVHAVDGVSFTLNQGKILGLVGESGCGKTTTARAVLRLIEPTSGQIEFEKEDILGLKKEEMRKRRKNMQIIYQDPYSSLSPRLPVEEIIGEPMVVHRLCSHLEKKERIADLVERVGLRAEDMKRYPHEFSGGQRQRISIARALATNPKLIIGDEPLSALDLSIRSQIINLLMELKEAHNLTYIIIAHDLGVVSYLCNTIMVMYLGRTVELADSAAICRHPAHPYTQALISAIPSTNPDRKKQRIVLEGDIPSPIHPPSGCPFHPRCTQRRSICSTETPQLREVSSAHYLACHQ